MNLTIDAADIEPGDRPQTDEFPEAVEVAGVHPFGAVVLVVLRYVFDGFPQAEYWPADRKVTVDRADQRTTAVANARADTLLVQLGRPVNGGAW